MGFFLILFRFKFFFLNNFHVPGTYVSSLDFYSNLENRCISSVVLKIRNLMLSTKGNFFTIVLPVGGRV